MSREQADQIRAYAFDLYQIYVHKAGLSHWDFQPLASKAFDAALAFQTVFAARYTPQEAVPVDAPSGAQAPVITQVLPPVTAGV